MHKARAGTPSVEPGPAALDATRHVGGTGAGGRSSPANRDDAPLPPAAPALPARRRLPAALLLGAAVVLAHLLALRGLSESLPSYDGQRVTRVLLTRTLQIKPPSASPSPPQRPVSRAPKPSAPPPRPQRRPPDDGVLLAQAQPAQPAAASPAEAAASDAARVAQAAASDAARVAETAASDATPVPGTDASDAAPVAEAAASDAAPVAEAAASDAAPVPGTDASDAAPVAEADASDAARVAESPVVAAAANEAPASAAVAPAAATPAIAQAVAASAAQPTVTGGTLATAPSPAASAAAAAAPTTTPAGPMASAGGDTPLHALAIPGSIRLGFDAVGKRGRLDYRAMGRLTWMQDGSHYDMRLEMGDWIIGKRVLSSSGEITGAGLAPTRFSDKFRSERAAHFERQQGRIIFSANTPQAALLPGTQDQLSIFAQLAALVGGDPQAFPVGAGITIPTAGTRSVEPWAFTVEQEELLYLPGGQLPALKLVRTPNKDYDQKVELWLAPALAYLPARIRISFANGDFLDQQWTSSRAP